MDFFGFEAKTQAEVLKERMEKAEGTRVKKKTKAELKAEARAKAIKANAEAFKNRNK